MTLRRIFTLNLLLLSLFSQTSLAIEAGRVVGLQMPAWLERDGQRSPLTRNTVLQQGDRLETGSKARLLLRLQEGSLVKLGANGQMTVDALKAPAQPSGVFTGFLNVLKGAFRFTTQAVGAQRKRDINVRIGTVTAGIRGTDLWGKGADEKDIVCLIEGQIEVAKAGYPSVNMADPLSFYIAPRDADPLPVKPVSAEQLAIWAAETEIMAGRGAITSDGRWQVILASFENPANADRVLGKIRAAGYAAERRTATVGGKQWVRLVLDGFTDRKDARHFADRINGWFGISSPWIHKG